MHGNFRAMSTYKLYYFNARGSVETIRIIFAQAGVKYEDVRFVGEQWAKEYKEGKMRLVFLWVKKHALCKGTPFERAPVLEVDGTKIAGSINILRFLGRKFGKKP